MKTNRTDPIFGSLTALAVLLVCALGCSSLGGSTANKSEPPANSNSAQKSATPPADIAGKYDVVGTNENGSPYRGALTIIKHGDVYQFLWNAGKQYDGVGVGNGGVVAVAFTGGANGKGCGVVSYKILADGTLDGVWGYWGTNESGTEKAERTSGSGVEGEYNTTGTNPNGNGYKGKLTVASRASGYTFSWSNNTSGFGVRQGDTLSVGLGGSRCAFVAYEIRPDGTLDGIWGGYGTDKTGTEKATKK